MIFQIKYSYGKYSFTNKEMKVDVYDTVYLSVVQMVKVLKNPE